MYNHLNMTKSEHKLLSKIGIIGDIHAESNSLLVVLEFLQNLQLQAILCVGDIVDGRENVDMCCQLLQQYEVITVCGNHDKWFSGNEPRDLYEATLPSQINLNSTGFIASLPRISELETLAGKLLLCHGLGTNDMARLTPDDYGYAIESNSALQELMHSQQYRFIINGHTHQRMVRSFKGLTIINAGTLKREHNPCFAMINFYEKIVQFYDIDNDLAIHDSKQYKL